VKVTDESIEELSRRNPFAVPPPGSPFDQKQLTLNVNVPTLSIKGRGKVCSYQIGLAPAIAPIPVGLLIGGGCDPTNIGARAQRVVSAKVTNQSML
jgi:hypothetical protein